MPSAPEAPDIPEAPAAMQRASASFVTEASGNSRVVNIYGDQHNTYEGLDYAEVHSQRTSLLQIRTSLQRLERHLADLETATANRSITETNHGDNTVTIVVNRTHLACFLFV
ncbi:hypothetical protein FIBSPDRAFT_956289 [Athelia psychrophila]|uniref:Uncharacterized protein n=1 Tax=Athelia psychrophila TaxID=1759441 RepID=A0A166H5N4_9AGAM|nr:hypothetical protein FIBSPDRAFT_956289 [Fibularhizoctonia sp. CBS 109695]